MEDLGMSRAWAGRRVLVTGATGIIGSWLVRRLLENGAIVVALVFDWDPQSELVRSGDVLRAHVVNGALEDFRSIERAVNLHETDTVIHLGAQTLVGSALRNPLPTFEANIRGTYNVLEVCRIHSGLVRSVVVASSDKAYGESDVLPYSEEMPLAGRHPYDVSKSCADLLAQTYAHTYQLPVTIARCGNVYGGGDLNWSRIVPGTIRSLLEDRPPVIRSDGMFTRDYIYVLDVVQGYLRLAERAAEDGIRGEAFNFGPGKGVTVLELTRAIQRLLGREDLEPEILNRAQSEIRHQYLDSTKAVTRLGWSPEFTLEEGLDQTIAWYRRFLAASGEETMPAPPLVAWPAEHGRGGD
jgi:CDP-glucose 4,6-dehydratase